MKARAHVSSKVKKGKKVPIAPVRMPGLNFDSIESEANVHEGAYGTDRAPTYQTRYAAQFPKRYIKRFLNWVRGRPAARKAGSVKRHKATLRRKSVVKRPSSRRAVH